MRRRREGEGRVGSRVRRGGRFLCARHLATSHAHATQHVHAHCTCHRGQARQPERRGRATIPHADCLEAAESSRERHHRPQTRKVETCIRPMAGHCLCIFSFRIYSSSILGSCRLQHPHPPTRQPRRPHAHRHADRLGRLCRESRGEGVGRLASARCADGEQRRSRARHGGGPHALCLQQPPSHGGEGRAKAQRRLLEVVCGAAERAGPLQLGGEGGEQRVGRRAGEGAVVEGAEEGLDPESRGGLMTRPSVQSSGRRSREAAVPARRARRRER